MYIVQYMPVDLSWEDGCTLINHRGDIVTWDGDSAAWPENNWKRAELYIVSYEFNKQKIVCAPSYTTLKWIKPGMEIKPFNLGCGVGVDLSGVSIRNITCPTCGGH